MTDSGDLLGKADALLGRYRGRAPKELPTQTEIPVLTEVVDTDPNGQINFQIPRAEKPHHGDRENMQGAVDPLPSLHVAGPAQHAEAALVAAISKELGTRMEASLRSAADRLRADLPLMVQAAVEKALAAGTGASEPKPE